MLDQMRESFVNVARNSDAFVNEARVELHEARARADFRPCIGRVEDTADADDLERAAREAIERSDHFGRAASERRTAQAACAITCDDARGRAQSGAARCRIGGDDARELCA